MGGVGLAVAVAVAALTSLMMTAPVAVAEPAAPAALSCPSSHPLTTVRVTTVPTVPGARVDLGGRTVTTDAAGRASARVCRLTSARDIVGPTDTIDLDEGRRAIFERTLVRDAGRRVEVAFRVDHEVAFSVTGLPTKEVESIRLVSSTGAIVVRDGLGPVFLPGTRIVRGQQGLEERQVSYAVESVLVSGSNVVNRAEVRFYPADRDVVRIRLLAYSVRVDVVDRIFGWPTGSRVSLSRPGHPPISSDLVDGSAAFTEVPRGEYAIDATAPGLRISRTLVLSRDQVVVMPVLTWVDLVVLLGIPSAVAIGLVLAPRPLLRERIASSLRNGVQRFSAVPGQRRAGRG